MKFKDLYPVLNSSCHAIIRDNFTYNTIVENVVFDNSIKCNAKIENMEVSRISPISEYAYEIILSNICTPLAKTIERVLLDKLDDYSEAKEKPQFRIAIFYKNTIKVYDGLYKSISDNLRDLNSGNSTLYSVIKNYGEQHSYIYTVDYESEHEGTIGIYYSLIIIL